MSKKPDLPTFLLWVAESYEAHAKTTDVFDEQEAYLGSAAWAREHLADLSATPQAHEPDGAGEPVAWVSEREIELLREWPQGTYVANVSGKRTARRNIPLYAALRVKP